MPMARPGSQDGEGETLKASKREASPKMRSPDLLGRRPLEDDEVDRTEVEVQRCMELTVTNRSTA